MPSLVIIVVYAIVMFLSYRVLDVVNGFLVSAGLFLALITLILLTIFANPGNDPRKLAKNIVMSFVLPLILIFTAQPLMGIIAIVGMAILLLIVFSVIAKLSLNSSTGIVRSGEERDRIDHDREQDQFKNR